MILEIIITGFALFAISRSYLRFKRNSESLWEFLLWVVIWSSVVVVVFYPQITDIPANFFGIERGVEFIVAMSILFLFYSTYRIYSKIEKVEQDITKLTRAIALREGDKKITRKEKEEENKGL